MVILTHPCAGKTYWSRRDKRVKDPNTDQWVNGPFVFVCREHARYRRYDAALALDEKAIRRNLDKRLRTQQGKKYNTMELIMAERDKVLRTAKERGLKVYTDIRQII